MEPVSTSPQSRHLTSGMVGPLVGAVAFAIFIGLLGAAARSWAAPVMAAAVLALGVYYVRVFGIQVGLVALLIVTSVVDHFTFSVGSLAVRPEQIAALVAIIVLAQMRLRQSDASWLKPSLAEILLLAWFAIGIVSSLLASPDRKLSAKILVLIAICSLGLFLPRRLLAGGRAQEQLETVTRLLLLVFATESAYGSIAYLLHVFGPTVGLTPNPASGHLSAYGTLWEQNVFGAFAAAGAIAWIYLGPRRFKWAAAGLAACIGGLFDSLTRAAWLAAALVAALGAAVPSLRRRIDARMAGVGALAGAAVIAATLIVDRIGQYNVLVSGGSGGLAGSVGNSADLVGRLLQLSPVWSDVKDHVVLGRGIASFEALHPYHGIAQHIASLPLLVFNDTGIVGSLVFAGFVIAVGAKAWSRRRDAAVVGFGQVAIVVGLTNLATETTELMVGWLLVGLLLAACDVASTATLQPAPTDSKVQPT